MHKRARMLQRVLGRFEFSQNEFEMRNAEKSRLSHLEKYHDFFM